MPLNVGESIFTDCNIPVEQAQRLRDGQAAFEALTNQQLDSGFPDDACYDPFDLPTLREFSEVNRLIGIADRREHARVGGFFVVPNGERFAFTADIKYPTPRGQSLGAKLMGWLARKPSEVRQATVTTRFVPVSYDFDHFAKQLPEISA